MALDPLTAGIDLATSVIQKIWPDKSAQEAAQLAAAVTLVQSQLEINKVEAASPSVFVSGWRPAIGWVCGMACAWNWIGLPVVKAGLAIYGHPLALSQADISEMMPILLGMLGLGGLRTMEKLNDKAAR
jgi:hypothetical protein